MQRLRTNRLSRPRYASIFLGGNQVLIVQPIPSQVTITSIPVGSVVNGRTY